MLKPADVQSKEFEIKMRGYDRDQVDDFLDEIIKDFEILYRDNAELTSKLEAAEADLASLKAQSEDIEKSKELARYQCEEMKKTARIDAEKIINQAKADAASAVGSVEDCKIRMKALCTEFLEKIDKM